MQDTDLNMPQKEVAPVWWMRVDFSSLLSSILAFSTDQKIKLHTINFGIFEHINALQPVGQAADFEFESKFEPLSVIWQSLHKASPEDK